MEPKRYMVLITLAVVSILAISTVTGVMFVQNDTKDDPEDTRAPVQGTVLAECFTGTWCTYCQGAEGALDTLSYEYSRDELAIIEWHVGDKYETPDGSGAYRAGADFYDVQGYPTTYFDGINPYVGGSTDPDDPQIYNAFKNRTDNELTNQTYLDMSSSGYLSGNSGKVSINVSAVDPVTDSDLWVHFVIVEDHNETVYESGREYRLKFTAVENLTAERISISNGQTLSYERNFTVEPEWNDNKIWAVAFVQKRTTTGESPAEAEVIQTSMLNLSAQTTPTKQIDLPLTSGGSNDGWNFISYNNIPDDTNITAMLDDPTNGIAGNYDKVLTYRNPNVKVNGSTIWKDDFEDGSVSPWTTGSGSGAVTVNTDTSNSGSYSMRTGEGEITAMSPAIDLSTVSAAELSLWIRRGDDSFSENPESGDDLAVDYLDDGNHWNELELLSGGGTPGEILTPTYELPSNATHSGFKVRLRQTGGSGAGYDYWHIDDVTVRETYYEASDSIKAWSSYVPGRSNVYNNIDRWHRSTGIWVHMTTDDTLTVEGSPAISTEITLKPGWNMVGYPSNTTGNNALPAEVDKIGYFDASDPYNVIYDHDPGSFTFEPGKGYWIHNPTGRTIYWTVNE